jgi:O-acetylhomoserine (thiol)-lyase
MDAGDELVAARQLYGGSINQFGQAFKKFGWSIRWASATDPDSFRKELSAKTKAIFVESIANPGGIITDLRGIAGVAKQAGVPLIVDNTLATPYLLRPFEFGADIVVHSLTKFLGGHGNSIGGVIIDGGTFDWSASGKYPMLSEPSPSYHGLKMHETFGNMAFAIACRALSLRDLGPAISPFNAFLCACSATATTLLRLRNGSRPIRPSTGCPMPDYPMIPIISSTALTVPKARAPCLHSA